MKVSVIIPALNEEENISGAVASAGNGVEVIVADCHSTDGTARVARALGAQVCQTAQGRGAQMDEAAAKAAGDVFVFLHADTRLPESWLEAVTEALKDERVAGGAFRLSIDSAGIGFRVSEGLVTLRSTLFNLIYGDQVIFARKNAFLKAGGFRKLPLMEDVDCVKRLRRQGRFVLLSRRATTSARRWTAKGMVKNSLGNWLILALYMAGVSPHRLCRWYYR